MKLLFFFHAQALPEYNNENVISFLGWIKYKSTRTHVISYAGTKCLDVRAWTFTLVLAVLSTEDEESS